jgi:hypothetical protein
LTKNVSSEPQTPRFVCLFVVRCAYRACGTGRVLHDRVKKTLSGIALAVGLAATNVDAQYANSSDGSYWSYEGSETATGSAPTVTLLPNGKVLVAGNVGISQQVGPNPFGAELFDPSTGAWTTTFQTSVQELGIEFMTATLLPSAEVLLVGGAMYDTVLSDPNYGGAIGDTTLCWLYESGSSSWSLTSPLPSPRFSHAATLLQNGKVLIAGGVSFESGPESTALLYDPKTGNWTATGSMASQRSTLSLILLQTGKVLAIGADDVTGQETAEVYDPDTGTWTATPALPSVIASNFPFPPSQSIESATLLKSGKVLVTQADGSAHLYDPAAGAWTPTASLPEPPARSYYTATLLPSGKVLVAGGQVVSDDQREVAEGVANAYLYDPDAETWAETSPLLQGRMQHFATPLQSGEVLVFGGVDYNSNNLKSAEVYTEAPARSVYSEPVPTLTTRGCSSTSGETFPLLVFACLPLLRLLKKNSALSASVRAGSPIHC